MYKRQWYARNGGPTGKEFTRNARYKLYRNGDFFDIQSDVLEKKSLAVAELGADAQQVHAMLKAALEQYTDARPERFANWVQNEAAKKKKNKNKKKGGKKNAD